MSFRLSPPGSRATPMPSHRWVVRISGSGWPLVASIGARFRVLPRGGPPRSVQYSMRPARSSSRSIGSGKSLNSTSISLRSDAGGAAGNVDSGPQDLPNAPVTRTLLRPVQVSADGVDRNSDTPPCLVAAVVVSLPRLHQGLDVRAVEVAAHHPHSLAIAPVQLSGGGVEVQLLRREGATKGNDRHPMVSVEVDPFDRAVVERWGSHVRPVDAPLVDAPSPRDSYEHARLT
jgi:hypothetical protein